MKISQIKSRKILLELFRVIYPEYPYISISKVNIISMRKTFFNKNIIKITTDTMLHDWIPTRLHLSNSKDITLQQLYSLLKASPKKTITISDLIESKVRQLICYKSSIKRSQSLLKELLPVEL